VRKTTGALLDAEFGDLVVNVDVGFDTGCGSGSEGGEVSCPAPGLLATVVVGLAAGGRPYSRLLPCSIADKAIRPVLMASSRADSRVVRKYRAEFTAPVAMQDDVLR
jgi:hypothetical protein